jgi:acyl dehydratase
MPGKFYEDLHVGMTIEHKNGRTVTEMDNVLFSSLTMNTQPLHLNKDFCLKNSPFKRRLANGVFIMGLVVGISVPDLTEGTIIANLGYDKVRHLKPVFHGDTIYIRSEVISLRESSSNPDAGIAGFLHVGRNQDGVDVISLERTVMVMKRPKGPD